MALLSLARSGWAHAVKVLPDEDQDALLMGNFL